MPCRPFVCWQACLPEDCAALCDYYEGLVDTISRFSLVLDSRGQFTRDKQFQNLR